MNPYQILVHIQNAKTRDELAEIEDELDGYQDSVYQLDLESAWLAKWRALLND